MMNCLAHLQPQHFARIAVNGSMYREAIRLDLVIAVHVPNMVRPTVAINSPDLDSKRENISPEAAIDSTVPSSILGYIRIYTVYRPILNYRSGPNRSLFASHL